MTSPETEPFAKGPAQKIKSAAQQTVQQIAQGAKQAAQTVGTTLKNAGRQVKNKVNEFATGWDIGNEVSNNTNGRKSTYLDKKRDNEKGDDGDTPTEAKGYGMSINVNKTLDGFGEAAGKAAEAVKHPLETAERADNPGAQHFANPNTGKNEVQAMHTSLDPSAEDENGRSVLGDRERRETSPGEFTTMYAVGGAGKKTVTALGKVPNEPKQGAGKALDLLNMGADLSAAVERGLKTMRSTVNVAMSPQMTGANVGAAFVSHVTGLLDATSQSLSEIGKDMDASVKRRTAEYGQRMKAQFAYMLDYICTDDKGNKKTLDQLDADDIGRLYDSMHNVWGREAEAVTKGLSPELAAGVRKAYGKALTDLGRYASEAKARTVTAKQGAKLERDKNVNTEKEKLHKATKDWAERIITDADQWAQSNPGASLSERLLDNPGEVYARGISRMVAGGVAPDKAIKMARDDVTQFTNTALKYTESEYSRLQASDKKVIDYIDKCDLVIDDNYDNLTKTYDYKGNTDDVAAMQSIANDPNTPSDYKNLLNDQIKYVELRSDLYENHDNLTDNIRKTNDEMNIYIQLRNSPRLLKRMQSKNADINAAAELIGADLDVPGYRAYSEYLSGKSGELNQVAREVQKGKTLDSCIRTIASKPIQSKIINEIAKSTDWKTIQTILGSDQLIGATARSMWIATNRKDLELLRNEYFNKTGKYAFDDRGDYTTEFFNWLDNNGGNEPNLKFDIDVNGTPVSIKIKRLDNNYISSVKTKLSTGTFNPRFVWQTSDLLLNELSNPKSEINKAYVSDKLPSEIDRFVQNTVRASLIRAWIAESKVLRDAEKLGFNTTISLPESLGSEWREMLGIVQKYVAGGRLPLSGSISLNTAQSIISDLSDELDKRREICEKNRINPLTDKDCLALQGYKMTLIGSICRSTGIANPYPGSLHTNKKKTDLYVESANDNPSFDNIISLLAMQVKTSADNQAAQSKAAGATAGTTPPTGIVGSFKFDENNTKSFASYIYDMISKDSWGTTGQSWDFSSKSEIYQIVRHLDRYNKLLNSRSKNPAYVSDAVYLSVCSLYGYIRSCHETENMKKDGSLKNNYLRKMNKIHELLTNLNGKLKQQGATVDDVPEKIIAKTP